MLNKTQDEITAKWKSLDTEHPLVSVKCLAFNHEKYIAQALDGFLIQETDFPFEVVVHDDASTDNTASILREYEKKYPLIVKPVYQTENQYSKHDRSLTQASNAPLKGKYVAVCEGDDYWTDPNKLQKQADFLESHEDYFAIGHNVRIVDDNGIPMAQDNPIWRKWFNTYTSMEDRDYTIQDLENGSMFGQTCTRMYRNVVQKMPKDLEQKYFAMDYTNGDVAMSLLCFCLGKVRCSSLVMANHRKSISNDSWTSKTFKKNMTRRDILSLSEQEKFANSFGVYPDFTDQQYRHVHRSFQIFKQNKSWHDFIIFLNNIRIINHKTKFLKKLYHKATTGSNNAVPTKKGFARRLFKNIRNSLVNFRYNHLPIPYGITKQNLQTPIIISLTSYPARFPTLHICLKSILNQTIKPSKVILWLDNNVSFEDIPQNILKLQKKGLEIRCEGESLKPHKKYFHAMKEFRDACIITIDDDVIYTRDMVASLYASFQKHPNCISARRVHKILYNMDDEATEYNSWNYDYKKEGRPSKQLIATGVGGVLYPPHVFDMDTENFNPQNIMDNAWTVDDIWLKFVENSLNIPVVWVPNKQTHPFYITNKELAKTSLYIANVHNNRNDIAIKNCEKFFGKGL